MASLAPVEIGLDRADTVLVAVFKRRQLAVKSDIGLEELLEAEV